MISFEQGPLRAHESNEINCDPHGKKVAVDPDKAVNMSNRRSFRVSARFVTSSIAMCFLTSSSAFSAPLAGPACEQLKGLYKTVVEQAIEKPRSEIRSVNDVVLGWFNAAEQVVLRAGTQEERQRIVQEVIAKRPQTTEQTLGGLRRFHQFDERRKASYEGGWLMVVGDELPYHQILLPSDSSSMYAQFLWGGKALDQANASLAQLPISSRVLANALGSIRGPIQVTGEVASVEITNLHETTDLASGKRNLRLSANYRTKDGNGDRLGERLTVDEFISYAFLPDECRADASRDANEVAVTDRRAKTMPVPALSPGLRVSTPSKASRAE
jgi:hypothetical protein